MRITPALFIIVLMFSGCRSNKNSQHPALWKSETFSVYNDSVTNHSFKAQILSNTEIRSNAYQEDRELIFKFCMLSHEPVNRAYWQ
jgi:hypothetical protein